MAWAQNIAQAYIDGYNDNSAHPFAAIAMGTNSSNYPWACIDGQWNTSGAFWGYTINHLISRSRVNIKSANDIESFYDPSQFGTWRTCGGALLSWFDGYTPQTSVPNYDFGDNPHSDVPGDWSIDQTWQVAWGRPGAFNMPEIYCNGSGWALSWVTIRAYKYMLFEGVTSLNGGPADCNPSLTWQASWNSLDQALSNAGYPGYVQSYAIVFRENYYLDRPLRSMLQPK